MNGNVDQAMDRSPALDRERFNCPQCGAFAAQWWTILVTPDDEGPWEHMEGSWGPGSAGNNAYTSFWNGARCASCEKWSIWYRGDMVYPPARIGLPAHPDMPTSAKELYEESAAVAVISRRAGAAMARAAVERVLKEVDPEAPKRANLEVRIARVKDRVSTSLGQLLDVVRVTGNNVLHQSDEPNDVVVIVLDDDEGPAVLTLLLRAANDLVDELITRPRVASELWDKLPESIRERSRNG